MCSRRWPRSGRDAPPGEAAALLQRAAALGYPAAIEDVRLGRAPLSADWPGWPTVRSVSNWPSTAPATAKWIA